MLKHLSEKKVIEFNKQNFTTGHNQYDGKKRERKNSKDEKEKNDVFSQIYLKISFRIFYDYTAFDTLSYLNTKFKSIFKLYTTVQP